MMSFKDALSRFRGLIMRRAVKNGKVSSVDLAGRVPSVTGSRRGAVVKRAFESLVADGAIKKTSSTVYNKSTHHQVTVYSKRK